MRENGFQMPRAKSDKRGRDRKREEGTIRRRAAIQRSELSIVLLFLGPGFLHRVEGGGIFVLKKKREKKKEKLELKSRGDDGPLYEVPQKKLRCPEGSKRPDFRSVGGNGSLNARRRPASRQWKAPEHAAPRDRGLEGGRSRTAGTVLNSLQTSTQHSTNNCRAGPSRQKVHRGIAR